MEGGGGTASCRPASENTADVAEFRVGSLYRSGGGGAVALCDLRPVHGVPPGLEVGGAGVLVRQVVRVLPDVVAEQRRLAGADRVVLVRRARDRERVAVEDQPRPARAELADARGLELLLEVVE